MDSIDEKGKRQMKKKTQYNLVTHQKIIVTKWYTTEIAALQNSVPSPVSINWAWAQPIFTGGPEASHN
jgi:hypothetical protein